MTEAEQELWLRINSKHLKGVGFSRQKPVGNYIVDFYSRTARLVIEIDGGHHFSEDGEIFDHERDAYLEGMGLKVIHISNSEVMNDIEGVIRRIMQELRV